MAIPTKTDLLTMDYVYLAQPFVNVAAKASIDTTTLDYSYQAQPFVAAADAAPPATPTAPTVISLFGAFKAPTFMIRVNGFINSTNS